MAPEDTLTESAPAPPRNGESVAPAAAPETPVAVPASPPASGGNEAITVLGTQTLAVSARLTPVRPGGLEPLPLPGETPAPPGPPSVLSLEERVRRLEDAIAHLQERRGLSDFTPERILTPTPVAGAATATPASPARPDASRPASAGPVWKTPQPATSYPKAPHATASPRRAWLLFDAWTEARAIARMVVDPRYRLGWSCRVLALALLAAFVASWYWVPFSSLAVVGTILNKAVDLVLAFALFKLLGHEARRYRETAPDLPPSLRL